jgi:hypothetical protein
MTNADAGERVGRMTEVKIPAVEGRVAGAALALVSAGLLFLALVIGVVTLGVGFQAPDALDLVSLLGAVVTFAVYADPRTDLGALSLRRVSVWPWIIAGAGVVLLVPRPWILLGVFGGHLTLSLALLCGRESARRYEPRPWLVRHLRARRCPFCAYPKLPGDRRRPCTECGRTVRYGVRGRWHSDVMLSRTPPTSPDPST